MKRLLTSTVIVTALAMAPLGVKVCAQPTSSETAAVEVIIQANQREVNHAIRTMDFDSLRRLWSPLMIVNSPGNNILNREQVFASIRNDQLKYLSVTGATESFFVSQNTAVEMGHEEIVMSNGPMAGKPLKRRYTDVWQKAGGHWQQIARQATYVGIDGGAVYGHPDPTLGH